MTRKNPPDSLWIEYACSLVIGCGMIYTMRYLTVRGYLPQPYFYDPADAWMDWFNTAEWARDDGVYEVWGTVYPPLNFVVIKLLGVPSCYAGAVHAYVSRHARMCDWVGILALHGFYIFNIVLVTLILLKTDRRTALPRAFALATGLPMTNSLERGNIIVIAFACLLLAHGPLLKSARLRWIAMGLAINFKIYMLASLLPYLLRRRWRWFEGAVISALIIYAVTLVIYGRGTPFEIYENVKSYNEGQANALLDVWYTATYQPLISLLQNHSFPMPILFGSRAPDALLVFCTASVRIAQLSIILAAAAAWLRPEAVSMYRLINLGMSFALITMESGGYSQMFMIFFAFTERWKGFGSRWAIVCCYVLCFQSDVIVDYAAPVVRDTFYSATTEIVTYYIMAGPFIRPLIFYSIPFALSCATIRAVWIDISQQGWQNRWRFRRDAPILLGAGEYQRPAQPAE